MKAVILLNELNGCIYHFNQPLSLIYLILIGHIQLKIFSIDDRHTPYKHVLSNCTLLIKPMVFFGEQVWFFVCFNQGVEPDPNRIRKPVLTVIIF